MQALWSRLAQSRAGCRCPSCTSTSTASAITARRGGATASRQTSGYLTSSTLLYSGIFAAAATADAGVKQRRRDQWDQAIADVKRDLGRPNEAIVNVEEARQPLKEGTAMYQPPRLQENPEDDPFREIYPWTQKPRWHVNTGPPLEVHRLPPQSVYADTEARERAGLRYWTPGKLERVCLATDLLQLNIIKILHEMGWDQEAAASVPETHGSFIRDSVKKQDTTALYKAIRQRHLARRRLRGADLELSNYRRMEEDGFTLTRLEQLDQRESKRITQSLNYHLQELFRQHQKSAITTPVLLGRLSYNMAMSTAPSNLETYNTLLQGFFASRQHYLTNEVIHSIRYTHVRPNEVTLATMFEYCTATNNAKLFKRWLGYVEGASGGLGLARPDIVINDAGRDRLVRKADGKIVQNPYPTPKVFSSIVQGVLQFSGFNAALLRCRNMGMEGWGLCMSGLEALLRDCAKRGDWKSGSAVWDQIQVLVKHERETVPMDTARSISPRGYEAMLKLYHVSGESVGLQGLWEEALLAHPQRVSQLTRPVLESCVDRGDWAVGKAAWDRLVESGLEHEQPASRGFVLDARSVTAMLKLCKQAGDRTAFAAVWSRVERCSLQKQEKIVSLLSGHEIRDTEPAPPPQNSELLVNSLQPFEDDYSWEARNIANQPVESTNAIEAQSPPGVVAAEAGERFVQLRRSTDHRSSEVTMAQLEGLVQSQELDDYETAERPMTMYAG